MSRSDRRSRAACVAAGFRSFCVLGFALALGACASGSGGPPTTTNPYTGQANAPAPAAAATNRAPTIAGTPVTSVGAGQVYTFTPAAADADGNPLSFTVTNKPRWATFDAATGRLSGTPAIGDLGTYANVTIVVSDGTLTATLASFTVTVQSGVTGSATLSWDAPTERVDGTPLADLAGYRIHYGTASGSYSNQATIANPGVTTYVVPDLGAGTYYFAIRAYDASGLESDLSAEVSKRIG
jgi:hypothetical protein